MKNGIKIILLVSLILLTLACINPQYEHLKKGDSYADEGKWNEAIAEYTKAIELKPDFVEAYSNRASVYTDMGEYDKAIVDCTKAIELDPQSTIPYYNRSIAYLYKGEYEKTIADCDKILELGLNSPWVHYHRGMAHFEMGNYKSAIDDFLTAKSTSTNSTFNQMVDQKIQAAENMMSKPIQQ
jgi:tetratricopeptide (TPR) repeat protein